MAETLADLIKRDNLNVGYSTAEHWTGRYWIDGKKIYERSVYLGNCPNNSHFYLELPFTISEIDAIVEVHGIAIKTTSPTATFTLPFVSISALANCMGMYPLVDTDNKWKIDLSAGTDRSAFVAYATLGYTKN